MKSATKDVLETGRGDFTHYGYQFWIYKMQTGHKSFWMRGALGQKIGLDPRTNRVIVVDSVQDTDEIQRLFREWESR